MKTNNELYDTQHCVLAPYKFPINLSFLWDPSNLSKRTGRMTRNNQFILQIWTALLTISTIYRIFIGNNPVIYKTDSIVSGGLLIGCCQLQNYINSILSCQNAICLPFRIFQNVKRLLRKLIFKGNYQTTHFCQISLPCLNSPFSSYDISHPMMKMSLHKVCASEVLAINMVL